MTINKTDTKKFTYFLKRKLNWGEKKPWFEIVKIFNSSSGNIFFRRNPEYFFVSHDEYSNRQRIEVSLEDLKGIKKIIELAIEDITKE